MRRYIIFCKTRYFPVPLVLKNRMLFVDATEHELLKPQNINYKMKVILDIKDNRIPFFMELVKSLDYISVVKEVKDERKSKFIADLAEAFNDAKLYEQKKKKLKLAKDLLNEL